jgi:DNA ligase-1
VVEWKWDGVRAQLLRRAGRSMLWSRGEEMIGGSFPELTGAAMSLPEGTVLDGEVLAFEAGRPLPLASLQSRLKRRSVQREFWPESPVAFMAYDLLEEDGRDLRREPLSGRRARLERLIARAGEPLLRASPGHEVRVWEEAQRLLARAREAGVGGLMIKRVDSPYVGGRERGTWWKLKTDPLRLDMALVAAQVGPVSGAGQHGGYSFAVRDGGSWVTVATAGGGLEAAEMEEVDRWVRRHTTLRKGPVRWVEPGLVFEIAFDSVQRSPRRRGGLAVLNARMVRWRRDKGPEAADALDELRAMLPEAMQGGA